MHVLNACPRGFCRGTLGRDREGVVSCSLCARGLTDPRPPTAEESAGEVVRNTNKLWRYKVKRRRDAAALKASQAD